MSTAISASVATSNTTTRRRQLEVRLGGVRCGVHRAVMTQKCPSRARAQSSTLNRVGLSMLHHQSFRKVRAAARKDASDPRAARRAQCRWCTARSPALVATSRAASVLLTQGVEWGFCTERQSETIRERVNCRFHVFQRPLAEQPERRLRVVLRHQAERGSKPSDVVCEVESRLGQVRKSDAARRRAEADVLAISPSHFLTCVPGTHRPARPCRART